MSGNEGPSSLRGSLVAMTPNFPLTIFQILADITLSHAIFVAIFGKMGGCFDKMGAFSLS